MTAPQLDEEYVPGASDTVGAEPNAFARATPAETVLHGAAASPQPLPSTPVTSSTWTTTATAHVHSARAAAAISLAVMAASDLQKSKGTRVAWQAAHDPTRQEVLVL